MASLSYSIISYASCKKKIQMVCGCCYITLMKTLYMCPHTNLLYGWTIEIKEWSKLCYRCVTSARRWYGKTILQSLQSWFFIYLGSLPRWHCTVIVTSNGIPSSAIFNRNKWFLHKLLVSLEIGKIWDRHAVSKWAQPLVKLCYTFLKKKYQITREHNLLVR